MLNARIFVIVTICVIMLNCNDNPENENPPLYADYTQIDYEPSFSNDNEKLLYVHSNPDIKIAGIYLYNSITKSDSLFISGVARCPGFSPDGEYFVFTIDNYLFKLKTNGDSLTELRSSGRNMYPRWSDDGSKIIYANTDCSGTENCGVYVMNSDGSGNTLIEPNANFPSWTDSGSTLIYLKPASVSGDSLFKYSLTGSERTFITVFNGNDHFKNSFLNYNDGDVIFCSTSSLGYSYIYSYNIQNSTLIRLTVSQGWSPYISLFSSIIIYTNRNPGNGRLYIMNKDGSDPHQYF